MCRYLLRSLSILQQKKKMVGVTACSTKSNMNIHRSIILPPLRSFILLINYHNVNIIHNFQKLFPSKSDRPESAAVEFFDKYYTK